MKELGIDVADGKSLLGSLSLGGPALTTKLRYQHPSGSASVEASRHGLSVLYGLKTKDITVTHKKATRLGNLQIKQYVPQDKLYLVPSPEIKMTFKPLQLPRNLSTETITTYDFQNRRGSIQQDLVLAGRHRAGITCNNTVGLSQVALTAKPGRSWLSSLGVQMTRNYGPMVKAEGTVRGGPRAVRYKADAHLQGREARLEVTVPTLDKVRLCLTAAMRRPNKTQKPSVVFGAKLEMP